MTNYRRTTAGTFGLIRILLGLSLALTYGLAFAQSTIKVGFFGPLTGPFAGLGLDAKKGAEFATKQINAAGGINGKKVDLIMYDDRGNRAEAVSVVRKLMQQDNVVAIIDGSLSLTSIAAAPTVNQGKTPMVVAYSNAVAVVKNHEYVFRWASVADVQGWVIAHDAAKKGFKTFAVLMQDEEYGRGIINGFEKGIEKLGGKIVYKRPFAPSEREFRSFLTEIKSLNVDAVVASGFGPGLTAIGRQGGELDVFPKAQLYVGCDLNEIDWYRGVGDFGDGTIGTLEVLVPTPNKITQDFHKSWIAEYKDPIVTHEAALTYDASRLLFDAIKRGGTSREGVRKALQDTKDFLNISGVRVSYTELREPLLPLIMGKWDGKKKDMTLVEIVGDPALIDPRPWYKYYK
jgi:branched-chain amino acid transport system substrate-binding protein